MSEVVEVVDVAVCGDLEVRVRFSDGEERIVDVGPLVERGGVFARLGDRDFFANRLAVMNGTVAWDVSGDGDETRCIDLDPVKVYEGGR